MARTHVVRQFLVGIWFLLFAVTAPALAHPHVWVTIKSELVYAPDGSITAIRHAWAFDDMFSVYATQGIEHKTNGAFTREELASLADTNVTSLKEYDFSITRGSTARSAKTCSVIRSTTGSTTRIRR